VSNSVPRVAVAVTANSESIQKPYLFNIFAMLEKTVCEYMVHHQGKHIKSNSLNEHVTMARQESCTHILFTDADMEFPLNTLNKLLSHEKPIVSGLYHTKVYPFCPVAGWDIVMKDGTVDMVNGRGKSWKKDYFPLPKNQLVRVDWVGIGCLLVDMKVFENYPTPHPFWDQWDHEKGCRLQGHDVVFSRTSRHRGYELYVDTSVDCGHRVLMTIDSLYAEAFHTSTMQKRVEELVLGSNEDRYSVDELRKRIQAVKDEQAGESLEDKVRRLQETPEYWNKRWAFHPSQSLFSETETVRIIGTRIPPQTSVVDVGCGLSKFLDYLKRERQCVVYALDFSKKAIERQRANGIPGEIADILKMNGDERRFDSVICSHLLEHFTEKQAHVALTNLRNLARKQVFIVVPGEKEKWMEHKQLFNQRTLRKLLKEYFPKVTIRSIAPVTEEDKQRYTARHLVACCKVAGPDEGKVASNWVRRGEAGLRA